MLDKARRRWLPGKAIQVSKNQYHATRSGLELYDYWVLCIIKRKTKNIFWHVKVEVELLIKGL